MPICPRCHNLISEGKWERHLKRCGVHHKHEPKELYVPSATPSWEGTQRGILGGPHGTWSRKKRLAIYLTVALLFGTAGLLYLLFFVLALL